MHASRFGATPQSAHFSEGRFTTSQVIYYGLLPPLIFEAGLVRKRKFFANFGTIFLYAVIGTLIAIVATGTLPWALNLDGSIDPNLNVNHFMLFGALISSTDPIATLGILKSAGANPLLYDLIFGESALNDCIAIVVFHIFHDLAIATDGRRLDGDGGSGEPPQPSGGEMAAAIGHMFGALAEIMPVSVLLGMVAGLPAWIRSSTTSEPPAAPAARAPPAPTPAPSAPPTPRRRRRWRGRRRLSPSREPPPRPHAELSLCSSSRSSRTR